MACRWPSAIYAGMSAGLAALIVGLAEAFAAGYVSVEYKDALAFVLMIAVLLWKPLGLSGRRVGL